MSETNAPASFGVEKARRRYEKSKKLRHRARVAWAKTKHRARKARHALSRAIDRRKAAQAAHDHNKGLDGIVEYAYWGAHNEPSIHYSQGADRMAHVAKGHTRDLPLYTDCSGFATLACFDAGVSDPNGLGYNHTGFTGTQYNHCPHVPKSQAKAGYLVEFGGYPGSHVVVLIEDGTKLDPLCVSHGQESGPKIYPLSVESGAHSGQSVNFLKTA